MIIVAVDSKPDSYAGSGTRIRHLHDLAIELDFFPFEFVGGAGKILIRDAGFITTSLLLGFPPCLFLFLTFLGCRCLIDLLLSLGAQLLSLLVLIGSVVLLMQCIRGGYGLPPIFLVVGIAYVDEHLVFAVLQLVNLFG